MSKSIVANADSTSQATPEERSLAELIAALESAGENEGEAVIARFLSEHPELADKARELMRWREAVAESRPDRPPSELPERLGEFRIVRVMRSGGMGVICEAIEDRLDRRVAIKIIRRGRVTPEARDRFLREQQVLAQMHQTNIVAIFGAGEQDGLQYFVMPLIEGASLSQVIEFTASSATLANHGDAPSLAKLAKRRAESEGQDESTHADARAANASTAVAPEKSREVAAPLASPWRGIRLSNEYYRSVAETIAAAAKAIDYAHRKKILHRDIKPANLMIEPSGQCWVIDFGLAGFLAGAEGNPTAASRDPATAGGASGLLGTMQYMAPEQFRLQADERTDVWGLGVTLYELLALRPAFGGEGERDAAAIRRRIETQPPAPLGASIPSVPGDLAAICLKAIEKDPAQRYATAEALADDLRRWLRRESPLARRPLWRQAWLWSQRNRGWALAIGAALAGVLLAAALLLRLAWQREAQTQMEKLQAKRLSPHRAGWFDEIENNIAAISRFQGFSEEERLRDQFVAALADVDAVREVNIAASASSVGFSADGEKILWGAVPKRNKLPAFEARLTSSLGETLAASNLAEEGPVGFSAKGEALQLVADPNDRFSIRLRDVEKKALRRAFRLLEGEPAEVTDVFNAPALALSPNGAMVAASATGRDHRSEAVVWSVATGARSIALDFRAAALAFSEGGEFLAAACEADRSIRLYDTADGKLAATIDTGHTPVQCLAFGRNPLLAEASAQAMHGWLLAAGDAGGKVTVWDLRTGEVKSIARGSRYGLTSLAFSPDGALLASAGRDTCKLSDVATGEAVLSISDLNTMSGVAFSPDRRLAIAGMRTNVESRLEVWRLDRGRGIEVFRGLSGAIEQAILSHDATLVAGLSTEWQVGIWDRRSGRLLQVVDVPVGDFVDSAALAFDHRNERLAFVSSRQAVMWEVGAAKLQALAELPSALDNVLAFSRDGKRLVLARMETRRGDSPPYERSFQDYPRILRVRNLLSDDPTATVGAIEDFDRAIAPRAITPFGDTILAVGKKSGTEAQEMAVVAIDGPTGREVWRMPAPFAEHDPVIQLDPTGESCGIEFLNTVGAIVWNTVIETRSRKVVRSLDEHYFTPGPGHSIYILDRTNDDIRDWELFLAGETKRRFTLNIDNGAAEFPRFSTSGKLLVWGNRDGTVSVADLEAIRKKLAGR